METAPDMDHPREFWVRQTTSDGKEWDVKLTYDSDSSQQISSIPKIEATEHHDQN
jgi:hypothetical protein